MAVAASAPTLIRESVPGYGVRWWPAQQLDEIAERIPHIHRLAPADATFAEPTCLYDGQTWPCPTERWRLRHNHTTHASVKVICYRLMGFGACVVLGLQLLAADSGPVRPIAPTPSGVRPVYVSQIPASLGDERVLAAKAKAQARLRDARVALPIRWGTESPATTRSSGEQPVSTNRPTNPSGQSPTQQGRTVRGLVIPPQPEHPSLQQVPAWPTFSALHQLVGDYLDIRYDIYAGWHLYCPEHGLERGLTLNMTATGLVRQANPDTRPVYGMAVVVGTGFKGEDVDVPEDLVVNVLGGQP